MSVSYFLVRRRSCKTIVLNGRNALVPALSRPDLRRRVEEDKTEIPSGCRSATGIAIMPPTETPQR
ncbi:hypothetical protein [Pararhizobium sp. A13]|uniref:hypothetical protein n=1 Tax=Pararhizobium sp. A13 TaxID=3133975 RepID=UPI00311AEF2F